jgi:hypothetical protein
LRIVQKSCLGLTQKEIAASEGLSRESINRVVNHSVEAEEFKAEMRGRWLALCEPAIEAVLRKLESGDENAADIALTILASVGVVEPGLVFRYSNRSRRKLFSSL